MHAFQTEIGIDPKPFVDENLRMVAFNFAKQNGQQTFIKLMVSVYDLTSNKEMFIDKVRELIAEHNYKDVSSI